MPTKKKEPAKKLTDDIDWMDDLGAGFENVDTSDLGIPFLTIVQKVSPQVDEESSKYIEGVKPGDIILSTNNGVYGSKTEAATFVPCGYQKAYVEWQPRESGGGLVGTHSMSILAQTVKNEKGQDILENGNLIVATAYIMGYIFDEEEDEWLPAVISLTSTQLKKARQWLNMMNSHKMEKDGRKLPLPMYSHKYSLSTQPESNEHGSWYGWKIETDSMVKEKLLVEKAREQHKEIANGSMRMLAAPTNDVPF
jgi:hypothetical protein